ncbi:hypothetical protein VKI22_01660 [Cyanobacterium aponinum UTEX 3221]|uniref:hypothetical protein n=1 Tax=Cyanobacterium aponinum TaxID=379064 RepID=UPI002B4BEF31|nr:hypothetical protein [Cyanobacterium aponinum]WRL38830.1 hypothetical protein VKI22_01660 [Cyanobacterium aponinum UTEX 3221]
MAVINKVVITNLTDKYFLVRGQQENFDYFGWKDHQVPNGGINVGSSGGGGPKIASMQVEGKDQTTERQQHINAQQVAQQSVIITTVEQYTARGGQTKNKKRSFSFPREVNIIWITYALNKEISDLTKVKPFKGLYTYKRAGGGRFVIGKVPDAIMTKTINDHIAAKQAQAAKGREATTTIEEIEPA